MKDKKVLKAISLTILIGFLFTNIIAFANMPTKKETVYVILTPNGNVKSQIVTDWVHSDTPSAIIKDKTELENIVNLKGEETPQKDGNYLTWRLNSTDLFYQGTISKELPFDVKIKYYLDDKQIEPQSLAGKSGKVKIRIEVENKQKKVVNINGDRKTIYLPITFAAVVNLPLDKFKNVKTNAGEVITEGNTQAVISILLPGLLESLGLGDKDSIDIPKYIEISADCEKFELSPIYMVATNRFIDTNKLKEIDSLEDLKSAMNSLWTSSQKILEGATTLSNGQKEFCINFEKFESGLNLLSAAADKLLTGAKELEKGANTLYESSLQLQNGTTRIYSSSQALCQGIYDFGRGVTSYTYGAGQFSDGAIKIIDGYGALFAKNKEIFEAIKKVEDGFENATASQEDLVSSTEKLLEGLKKILDGNKKELEVLNLIYNGFDTILTGVEKLKNVPVVKEVVQNIYDGLDKQRQTLKNVIDSKSALIDGLSQIIDNMNKMYLAQQTFSQGITQLKNVQEQISKASDLIAENEKVLEAGAAQIKKSKKDLDDGARKLSQANGELTNGAKSFCDGAKKLDDGRKKFSAGAKKLNDGTRSLSQGLGEFDKNMKTVTLASQRLYQGAIKLEGGAKVLSQSYEKFHNEGIKKLYSKAGDLICDVNDLKDTIDALQSFSKSYRAFSGISNEMDGEVKFILKTDEIKAQNEQLSKKDVTPVVSSHKQEKKSFWKWLLGLLHIDFLSLI